MPRVGCSGRVRLGGGPPGATPCPGRKEVRSGVAVGWKEEVTGSQKAQGFRAAEPLDLSAQCPGHPSREI